MTWLLLCWLRSYRMQRLYDEEQAWFDSLDYQCDTLEEPYNILGIPWCCESAVTMWRRYFEDIHDSNFNQPSHTRQILGLDIDHDDLDNHLAHARDKSVSDFQILATCSCHCVAPILLENLSKTLLLSRPYRHPQNIHHLLLSPLGKSSDD